MKKRIYFILTDENLFHPYYFLGILNNIPRKKYEIIGVTVIKETYGKGFLNRLYKEYNLWGFIGFFCIAFLSATRIILDKFHIRHDCSIETLAKTYAISFVETKNVNSASHLWHIRNIHPDIIVSSCGQIFKDELLSVPKIACINRHTALLPKYGGVLPVFWAMLHNEKEFGVSIHYMVKKIDQGDVIYQESIPLKNNNSLFKNYILGFDKSIEVTIRAFDNVLNNKIISHFHTNKKQYFSFPNFENIRNFKRKNKTFSLDDSLLYFSKRKSTH